MQQETSYLIAKLLDVIATEESQIEQSRINLAQDINFNPLKAFITLDFDQDNFINPQDLSKFMKIDFQRVTPQEAVMIIKEYDSNLDLNLDLEEFCQFFLPSTSLVSKDIALDRAKYSRVQEMPLSIVKKMVDHIEKELRFIKKRNEIKRQLLVKEDFIKQKYFNYISQNQQNISIDQIVNFMRTNLKRSPRAEELEAILRRVDHEGNQQINFAEFSEMTSCNEENLSPEQAEDVNSSELLKKCEFRNDISHSPGRQKSNSKRDLYEKDIDQTLEEYEKSQEKTVQKKSTKDQNQANAQRKLEPYYEEQQSDKRSQEEQSQNDDFVANEDEQEQEQESPLEFRFLSLLKSQIKLDKEVEIQKETLYSNASFNPAEAFKIFNNKSSKSMLTEDDLNNAFANMNLPIQADRLIMMFDKDQDGQLSYEEFCNIISPLNPAYRQNTYQNFQSFKRQDSYTMKKEQQQKEEWISDLKEVLQTVCRIEEILIDIKNPLNIDGDLVFSMIDKFEAGKVTIDQFKNWVSDKCGFNLKETEVKLILKRYDKNNDLYIKREEFMLEVIPQLYSNNNEEGQEDDNNQDEDYQQIEDDQNYEELNQQNENEGNEEYIGEEISADFQDQEYLEQI